MERVLLLVDDEENIVRSLKRTLRRSGYHILTALGGEEGLAVLEQNEVGVIISDQRMPGMIGTEFLCRARERCPDSVRIMLSGYTELQSVTEAINQGAIYKFLTKPWEDDLLRTNIEEAFEYYELRRENQRLARELSDMNHSLEQRVKERTRDVMLSTRSLEVAHQVLEALPVGVVGMDGEGTIVTANRYAHQLLDSQGTGLVGRECNQVLPSAVQSLLDDNSKVSEKKTLELDVLGKSIAMRLNPLSCDEQNRGYVLMCTPIEKL